MSEDLIKFLEKINLQNKKILSVGSGEANFEKYISKKYSSNLTCIDRRYIDKNIINADFIQYKFKQKFDIIFFISSIQFIIGENYKNQDKKYFEFIKEKIYSLLKKNAYIFINLPKKEWFKEFKPDVPNSFLKSLDNAYENILKMKFEIIQEENGKYYILLLLKKNS